MRTAVAVEEDKRTVSRVFSRAPYFLIQEDGRTVDVVKNPYTHAWPAAPYVVEMLSKHGVRKVVAGNFGPIALEHLKNKGIQTVPMPVYTQVVDTVLRLRKRLRRRLRRILSP